MIGRVEFNLMAGLSLLGAAAEARAGAPAARNRVQRDLDAMTRHDLCARDDAALSRLHRRLSRIPDGSKEHETATGQ